MGGADAGSISRHRLSETPGAVYTATILEPSYHYMVEKHFGQLLEANEAWIVMLTEQDIVARDKADAVLAGLARMRDQGAESFAEFNPAYEYFYSHLEQRLTELAGADAAGEINIARTRPEPLTRMALRVRILAVADALHDLLTLLLDLAEAEVDTVMPQWTHMQPAQPSTLGHYLAGMADAVLRDMVRLQAAYATTNECTLGCGALAGTSYPIDRERVASLLGFDGVRENSIDCVASGDHLTETGAALSGLAINLSRLCEDCYLWCTHEFGFAEVGDAFAGSSSMMPQKKNAYPFEYVRARAARAVADAAGAYLVLHNTDFGDIKDVEEEMVPPVLRMLDEMVSSLRLLTGTIASMTFHRERMAERAAAGFSTATELAAVIHRRTELDFRSAHRVVGSLVRLAVERSIEPEQVDAALVDEAARESVGRDLGLGDSDIADGLDPRRFVAAHTSYGGAAPESVRANLERARSRLAESQQWLQKRRDQLAAARSDLDAAIAERSG